MFGVTEIKDEPRLCPVKGPDKRLYFRKEEIDQLIDPLLCETRQGPLRHDQRACGKLFFVIEKGPQGLKPNDFERLAARLKAVP
jgi:hypothetical protein